MRTVRLGLATLVAAMVLLAASGIGVAATPAALRGAPELVGPPPAPPTTLGGIPTGVPPPSTLPIQTTEPSGHVSPVFALVSGAGLAAVFLIMTAQWILTRPRRKGWTL